MLTNNVIDVINNIGYKFVKNAPNRNFFNIDKQAL